MSDKEICNWYILRIAYRTEKKVDDVLNIAGIKHYIPFKTVEYSWNATSRRIETPVFPCLGFAYVSDFDLEMLKIMKEVSFLIDKDGRYLTLSDNQMDKVKNDSSSLWHDILKPENQ